MLPESPEDRIPWQDRLVRDAVAAERERCGKVADEAQQEIMNAPHSMGCNIDWHGNAKKPCSCFKAKVIASLGKIRNPA